VIPVRREVFRGPRLKAQLAELGLELLIAFVEGAEWQLQRGWVPPGHDLKSERSPSGSVRVPRLGYLSADPFTGIRGWSIVFELDMFQNRVDLLELLPPSPADIAE
jgi:hypothetical protein